MREKDDDVELPEDFDDEVWDEEQWERFMQEADRKVEGYLSKFEEELLSKKESPDNEGDGYALPGEYDEGKDDKEQWKEAGSGWHDGEEEDSYRQLSVWRTAYHFSLEVLQFAERSKPPEGSRINFDRLLKHCSGIPAKIASGHSMGYDREVLEGNIAYCKRALKDAERCIDALEGIRIKEKPTKTVLRLYGAALKTKKEIREWIAELRRRIWWR